MSFNIYRKPTTADTIIPNNSNHPPEQRMAAIRYLDNQLITYSMNDIHKKKEYDIIKQTMRNNK